MINWEVGMVPSKKQYKLALKNKIILNGKINAMEFVDLEEFAAGIYYIHLFKDNIKIKTTSLVLSN